VAALSSQMASNQILQQAGQPTGEMRPVSRNGKGPGSRRTP